MCKKEYYIVICREIPLSVIYYALTGLIYILISVLEARHKIQRIFQIFKTIHLAAEEDLTVIMGVAVGEFEWDTIIIFSDF